MFINSKNTRRQNTNCSQTLCTVALLEGYTSCTTQAPNNKEIIEAVQKKIMNFNLFGKKN